MADATRTTRFQFWLWLIHMIGVFGAAPLARRLAAGVGGGIALARSFARRMGQAQLENETRYAAAQPGSVPGCDAVTTTKTGGGNVSRSALWGTNAGEKSRLHVDCNHHACPGHRGEHGDLQHRQIGSDPALAFRAA